MAGLILAATLTGATGRANAAAIVETSGMQNPIDFGFAALGAASPISQFNEFGGSDNGEDYWQLDVAAARNRSYAVNLLDSEIFDASGWTATMRARVLDADYQAANLSAAMLIGDGGGMPVSWGIGLIGGPNATHTPGVYAFGPGFTGDTLAGAVQVSSIDPTLAFNNYQVVYDPGSDSASFYVNGTLGATLPRSNFPTNTVLPRFLFGDGVSAGPASSVQYALARFDIGQHVVPDSAFPSIANTPQVMHQGQANPAAGDFNLGTNTTAATVTIGPGTDTEDHWRLTTVDPSYTYQHVFTNPAVDLTAPEGWLATARLKLINSDTTSGGGAGQGLNTSLEITDKIGQGSFLLSFIGGPEATTAPGIYHVIAGFGLGTKLSDIDPTLGYHTYQLEYDPSTDTAQFILDGVPTGDPLARGLGPVIGITQPRFNFGDSTSTGTTGADVHFSLLRFESLAAAVMPDLNMDGKVDIFDVAIVSNNWGNTGAPGSVDGDANKDGVVDIFDVALISNNWNPGGEASALPEPAALSLVAVAGVFAIGLRVRRRSNNDA